MNRADLKEPILQALRANEGKATIVEVCKFVWDHYESDLRKSGKYFYTWQYELRWASDQLVVEQKIAKSPPRGAWRIV